MTLRIESVNELSNADKIILDLCGGTGAWSRPYKEVGYTVINVTLPEYDVRTYQPPPDVYGILAAPPCTDFAIVATRHWENKDIRGDTIESMGIVLACLKIIALCKPNFWALENPVGRLSRWLGKPAMKFNPTDYGDNYTKKTYLWGNFNKPTPQALFSLPTDKDRIQQIFKRVIETDGRDFKKMAELRSITPLEFAKAFFEANK